MINSYEIKTFSVGGGVAWGVDPCCVYFFSGSLWGHWPNALIQTYTYLMAYLFQSAFAAILYFDAPMG